jgi:HlyD family secretion protein
MSLIRRRAPLLLLILAVVAVGTVGYLLTIGRAQAPRYRTVKVDRGPVTPAVSATGALNAVITVQVGSQVSGQIKDLYVDYNSPVKKGQLVARLDPDPFQAKVNAAKADVDNAEAVALNQRANVEKVRADVESARAAVAAAQATIAKAQADVENVRAALASAQANVARDTATQTNAKLQLDRSVELLRRQLIAQSDKDQAQMSADTAQAQVEATRAQVRAGEAQLQSAQGQLAAAQSQAKASEAQLQSARAALGVAEAQQTAAEAGVRNKQATLDQTKFDLEHSEIRAPVDGVVISRAVDVGQTVAASLQAPTLFTIAQDLTRMQVETAIDEADVGRLAEGMAATFTVDAFPGRTFRGQIVQIRKSPQVVQNVVTYTTIIAVSNPEGILMPGMTANVRIEVDRKEDVLRLPTAALRFRPAGTGGPGPGGSSRPTAPGAPPRGDGGAPQAGGANQTRGMRDALVRDLALNADQTTRLDAILAEVRQAFAGLRGQGGDEAGRDAQRKRVRAELQEKVRAILTPDQRKKYDVLLAAQEGGGRRPQATPGRVYTLGTDGKPQPIDITTGASDGSFVEVLQGDLQPGQEVVIGLATTPTSSGGGGPRLRL